MLFVGQFLGKMSFIPHICGIFPLPDPWVPHVAPGWFPDAQRAPGQVPARTLGPGCPRPLEGGSRGFVGPNPPSRRASGPQLFPAGGLGASHRRVSRAGGVGGGGDDTEGSELDQGRGANKCQKTKGGETNND